MNPLRKIKNPDTLLWVWLGIWWAINLIQAGCTELANDEAYYHMFAGELAWGYFDHPPMTALLVWLGNFIGGELGVRFFFTLLQPLYLWLLWLIVRPPKAQRQDAVLFLLLSAAMPILQLYGFIAVPDGPLMLFTALFLYCYKRFTENGSWLSALAMGVAIAAMAYSKYHGALVVLLVLLSNPRLLKNPKTYAAGALAALLLVPHLIWQYQHDWISFQYHLMGRNRDFQFNFVTEYILNLFAIFNPLLFPVFVKGWWKDRPAEPVKRALNWISAGFILFFLASTLRGYVQPQWDIPATFGVIAVLFAYAQGREKLRRYMVRVGWITVILLGIVRIEMIFNPIGINFEIFHNREAYGELKELAGDAPIIFDGGYTSAAKYAFYADGESYAQPSSSSRSSQYELRDDDTPWVGRRVLMEVKDTVPGARSLRLSNGKTFTYWENPDFMPTRKVTIRSTPLPERVRQGETLDLTLDLSNPYPYGYAIDGQGTVVLMVWKRTGEPTVRIPLHDVTGTLAPEGTLQVRTQVSIPGDLKPKEYQVGFALANTPATTWFNSPRQGIKVEKK